MNRPENELLAGSRTHDREHCGAASSNGLAANASDTSPAS